MGEKVKYSRGNVHLESAFNPTHLREHYKWWTMKGSDITVLSRNMLGGIRIKAKPASTATPFTKSFNAHWSSHKHWLTLPTLPSQPLHLPMILSTSPVTYRNLRSTSQRPSTRTRSLENKPNSVWLRSFVLNYRTLKLIFIEKYMKLLDFVIKLHGNLRWLMIWARNKKIKSHLSCSSHKIPYFERSQF